MTTFLTIVGGVLLVILGLGALCLLMIGVFIALEKCMEQYKFSVMNETRASIGNRMLSDSWWFSEDVNTYNAMALYGKSLLEGRGDVSSIREDWRKVKE